MSKRDNTKVTPFPSDYTGMKTVIRAGAINLETGKEFSAEAYDRVSDIESHDEKNKKIKITYENTAVGTANVADCDILG